MDTITPHAFPKTGAKRGSKPTKTVERAILGSGSPIPVVYNPDYSSIPVYYQRQLPTCGANAGTMLSNILNGRIGCPRYLWTKIRDIDGLLPENGSALETIGNALQNDGVCDLSLLPDDTTLAPEKYDDPTIITPAMNLNAATAGVDSFDILNAPFTFAQLQQLIYQNKAIILLVECGTGWWTNKAGQISWSPSDLFPIELGIFSDDHYIVATGFDSTKIYGYSRNSWSEQWGDNGNLWFDATYLPHIVEVGIGTPKTIPTIATLNPIVALFKRIFGIR